MPAGRMFAPVHAPAPQHAGLATFRSSPTLGQRSLGRPQERVVLPAARGAPRQRVQGSGCRVQGLDLAHVVA